MARLSKRQRKQHEQAEAILRQDVLTMDDREFVFKNWLPMASYDVGAAGVFFTPFDLAADFRIDAGTGRIIDLCSGIGMLAYWCRNFTWGSETPAELVCVEINPSFVEIGKKLLPEVTWINADVFDVPELDLGHFDTAIANPPFGNIRRHGKSAPRYTGNEFAYHVVDIASDIADHGAFIISQSAAPFNFSGVRCYERKEGREYKKFEEQTGIILEAGCGIDCSIHRDDWQGTSPAVEIVTTDFTEAREARKPAQAGLFDVAA